MHRSADPEDVVRVLAAAGAGPGVHVGVALAPQGAALAVGDLLVGTAGDGVEVVRRVAAALNPRLVWWSARSVEPLVRGGVTTAACWDLGAVHRLLHGGTESDPAVLWAAATGLDAADRPRTGQLDLLGSATGIGSSDDPTDADDPVRPDGHLRPSWARDGPPTIAAAGRWARAALQVARAQVVTLSRQADPRRSPGEPPLPVLTAWSESAAELLAVDLGLRGLPLDRDVATALIAARVGPRAADAAAAAQARAERDEAVRSLVPGAGDVDLRNPASVRELLTRVGIDVKDTRSWRLEPFRGSHPLVGALLDWRRTERIATTYGYGWLDGNVGADGRLRGAWTGCDGAAGRMTASAGLHNLPAELRPAVAAEAGHLLVRADLGQVEPRVLAAVSGDEALAQATRDDDLYAPVAARLGVDRPTAKIAVLAAMYGQTSGAAGEALRGLERAFPVAMGFLRAAHEAGGAGREVRTYGGRRVPVWALADPADPAGVAARGRFTRNAVVQGAAAELFKIWAVSVRAALPAGAEIVLCLHDELLVHAPETTAPAVAELLGTVLESTARRWTSGLEVRFVADVSTLARWSDAKA